MSFRDYFIICCISIGSLQAQTITTPAYVKKREVREFDLSSGIRNQEFVLTNGDRLTFRISIPEIEIEKPVPFILALHWAGDENVYEEFADCLAFPATEDLGAIVLTPSLSGGRWTNPDSEQTIINMVKQILKHWPVDKKKVGIMGYSNGAIATWQFASEYPELFTAGVAVSGFYGDVEIKIPMMVLHGANDELFQESEVAQAMEKASQSGGPINYRVFPSFSHYMACAYADKVRNAFQVIHENYW